MSNKPIYCLINFIEHNTERYCINQSFAPKAISQIVFV